MVKYMFQRPERASLISTKKSHLQWIRKAMFQRPERASFISTAIKAVIAEWKRVKFQRPERASFISTMEEVDRQVTALFVSTP